MALLYDGGFLRGADELRDRGLPCFCGSREERIVAFDSVSPRRSWTRHAIPTGTRRRGSSSTCCAAVGDDDYE